MRQNNQLIKPAVIAVIVAGSLGSLFVLGGDFMMSVGSAKLFGISFLFILFGITAAISMVLSEKSDYKSLGKAGMITSVSGFLLGAISIISEFREVAMVQLSGALLIASIGLAHICLLYYFNLQNKYAYYARTTAVTAIAVFSFLFMIRLFEPMMDIYALAYSQTSGKLLVAALIIDLSATLLVPLCNRLEVPPVELELSAPEETSEETTAPLPPEGEQQQS